MSQLQLEISSYKSEATYTIDEMREIFKNVNLILERAEVSELRTLMHLMIERITLDSVTKSPDTVQIQFNRTLCNYLCITQEEAKKASSFSFTLNKVLRCEIEIKDRVVKVL